ncbi:uncharacterized protein LOC131049847 isoform X2 [Cryptomeria japonica]|uniref:uncharacterized protein LOC131049847 isoform X2 n=1 Tax=Cryptomeria japonica TaxID=3369 RepID=UPI0025AB882E|nr:uncharacterized protein LOC131049847 isoform X2 [Cryptomeria japonica]
MATTEIEREREKENEKQQEQSRVWETCGQWVALVLQAVATFIENAASISILITRLLAFVGLEPLLCHALSIPRHYDHLLPPRSAHDMDKLTVVLDLDETLVCAYESSSLPSFIHNQATQAGIKWFELQCVSVDKEDEGKQKVNHVTVYERPGLQEFLSEASEFAELVLFTAGLEGYAKPLVDKIDSENRIAARLYRPATVTTKYRDHVKDLSCLARDLRRTVIIDNNPFSFLLQPMNGIPCVPFTGAHTDDQQVLDKKKVHLPLGGYKLQLSSIMLLTRPWKYIQ